MNLKFLASPQVFFQLYSKHWSGKEVIMVFFCPSRAIPIHAAIFHWNHVKGACSWTTIKLAEHVPYSEKLMGAYLLFLHYTIALTVLMSPSLDISFMNIQTSCVILFHTVMVPPTACLQNYNTVSCTDVSAVGIIYYRYRYSTLQLCTHIIYY